MKYQESNSLGSMARRTMFLLMLLLGNEYCLSQGKSHAFLIGYTSGIDSNVMSKRGWLYFDSVSISVIPDNFKMSFRAAQGNISDENGNLLLVSNDCWIMDANGDTMQNGSGLNPNPFTTSWCTSTSGIPFPHSNLIIPFPGDSNKYVLFHQTGSNNLPNNKASELYYSVIDMSLANGLGGVILGQKNLIAIQDTLNQMLAACKHANGRDWWIIAFEDNSDKIYNILFTPFGISNVYMQNLGFSPNYYGMGQAQFSPDGRKFAYHHRDFGPNGIPIYHTIRIFDFNRCSGNFFNGQIISYVDSNYSGNGLAFSSNSKYLYFDTFLKIFQLNTDTSNIQASMQLVAQNDTFYSPYPPFLTDFWMMYLAANGKIYVSSGNGVIDMHYINYPDSSGVFCDVQQHALHLPCYYVRGHVYHPNYYLGCDTISGCPCLTNVDNLSPPDFKFRVYPNPVSNNMLNIGYLLPQNKGGMFEIFDVTGKWVFKYTLPPWSNEQSFKLPELSNGVYNCVITSTGQSSSNIRVSKKIAVIRN